MNNSSLYFIIVSFEDALRSLLQRLMNTQPYDVAIFILTYTANKNLGIGYSLTITYSFSFPYLHPFNFEAGFNYLAQAGLNFIILLPQPYVTPCTGIFFSILASKKLVFCQNRNYNCISMHCFLLNHRVFFIMFLHSSQSHP